MASSSAMPLPLQSNRAFATRGTRTSRRLRRVVTCSYAAGQSNPARVTSGNSRVVTMVDPLEAKRLAAEEMERIKSQATLKRRRKIEAINGGWAMLGLVAGIIIEAGTGKSIPDQIAEYTTLASTMLTQIAAQLRSSLPPLNP